MAVDANYRIVHGVFEVRALISSLFSNPGPKPDLVYGISDVDMLERHFPEFSVNSGNRARLEAHVPSRFIYTSIKGPTHAPRDARLLRESRYMPPEKLDGCTDLTIVGDTVVFVAEEGPGVVAQSITSSALAAQMRGYFKFLWDHAA
jgi:hypothetical protein